MKRKLCILLSLISALISLYAGEDKSVLNDRDTVVVISEPGLQNLARRLIQDYNMVNPGNEISVKTIDQVRMIENRAWEVIGISLIHCRTVIISFYAKSNNFVNHRMGVFMVNHFGVPREVI